MFLRIVFICSTENVFCVCAASLVGKVVSIETKLSYEKVEIAACVVGRARDCVRRSLAKAMLPLKEMNFGVTVGFVCLVIWGECALSPLKWPRGEMRARRRELNCASHRHSQFWGWHKVVPVRGMLNVSNLYSTGIPCKESIN